MDEIILHVLEISGYFMSFNKKRGGVYCCMINNIHCVIFCIVNIYCVICFWFYVSVIHVFHGLMS